MSRHPTSPDVALRLVEASGTEYCACTFYLVFKEPVFTPPDQAPQRFVERAPRRLFLAQGNLAILLAASDSVNPLEHPYFRWLESPSADVAPSLTKSNAAPANGLGLAILKG